MNKSQIVTLTRDLIAEASASLSYSDATVLAGFIHEGQKDICVHGRAYQKSLTLTVETGVPTYLMPWDFIEPIVILDQNRIALDPMTIIESGQIYVKTGDPHRYYQTLAAVVITARANLTAYVIWPASCIHTLTYIVPATANGFMYECIFGGTSAAIPPTYPTALSGTVVDGSITWKCRELMDNLYKITLVDTPTTGGGGAGTYTIHYSALDEALSGDTDSPLIPLDKHPALSSYAAYRHFLRAKDRQLAAIFYQDYAKIAGIEVTPQDVQTAVGG
jgi:hypothetical protein